MLDLKNKFSKNKQVYSKKKFQDARLIYKDQLYFCTLAMNNPNMKLGKQCNLQQPQKE